MCGISCPEGREMKWHCTSNHTVPLIRKGNAQNHRRIIFVDQPLPPLRLVEISSGYCRCGHWDMTGNSGRSITLMMVGDDKVWCPTIIALPKMAPFWRTISA